MGKHFTQIFAIKIGKRVVGLRWKGGVMVIAGSSKLAVEMREMVFKYFCRFPYKQNVHWYSVGRVKYSVVLGRKLFLRGLDEMKVAGYTIESVEELGRMFW